MICILATVIWLVFISTSNRGVRVGEDLVGGLDTPDLAAVLTDGPVRAELARGGDVHDGHLGPLLLVLKTKRRNNEDVNYEISYLV